MNDEILKKVADLYSNSIKEHGISSKGVGWKDATGHVIRFDKLCEVLKDDNDEFSVNDLGCGYGSLFQYLHNKKKKITQYNGYDISNEMLNQARKFIAYNATFYLKSELDILADYSITSGIFNVRFETGDSKWEEYVIRMLHNLNDYSSKGFSFNMLSQYVDWKEEHLYYADPCYYFDYCKRTFSRKVLLLHDYDLWEWTIIVRK